MLSKINRGDLVKQRIALHPINPLFLQRHSSRAMSGEEITEKELMTLFEAARWRHLHLITSHGDLFMHIDKRRSGTIYLISWCLVIRVGLCMVQLLY